MTSEKNIENDILIFLSKIGIMAWKNQSIGVWDAKKKVFRKSNNKFHIKGTADILGIFQGRFLAIEVKTKKGVLSPDQKLFLNRINEEGGIAFVGTSVEQVARELLQDFPDHQILKQYARG